MTPDEAAAAWIVRVEDGPLSAADQAAFDEWKAESPANVAAYERAEAAWNLYENPQREPVMDAMRASALAIRPKPRRSEERRVGKQCVGRGSAGGSPHHKTKKQVQKYVHPPR